MDRIQPFKLNSETRSVLEDLTSDFATLHKDLAVAEEIGINVDELKQDLDKTIKLRDGLLKHYS